MSTLFDTVRPKTKHSSKSARPLGVQPTPGADSVTDPRQRLWLWLWLFWPTILANERHMALMKYKIASDYSYFHPPATSDRDAENRLIRTTIEHAHFNEAWIRGQEPGTAKP